MRVRNMKIKIQGGSRPTPRRAFALLDEELFAPPDLPRGYPRQSSGLKRLCPARPAERCLFFLNNRGGGGGTPRRGRGRHSPSRGMGARSRLPKVGGSRKGRGRRRAVKREGGKRRWEEKGVEARRRERKGKEEGGGGKRREKEQKGGGGGEREKHFFGFPCAFGVYMSGARKRPVQARTLYRCT